jgi:hypothetical protein
LLSWELTPDGAPVPFRLLGEDLVAFKDTSGPSLNILIKLMSIVSLVFASAFGGGLLNIF